MIILSKKKFQTNFKKKLKNKSQKSSTIFFLSIRTYIVKKPLKKADYSRDVVVDLHKYNPFFIDWAHQFLTVNNPEDEGVFYSEPLIPLDYMFNCFIYDTLKSK